MLVRKTQFQRRNEKQLYQKFKFARNFFPEWFGRKQIEAIRFQNGFHDNSAQNDCSKEMWIPILKGLKHLNTILNCFFLIYSSHEPNWLRTRTSIKGLS